MKRNRGLLLALVTISILAISNLLNFTVSTSRFNQSYPSVICPPNTSGLTTAISLTSSKTQVRKTGTSSMGTREAGISRYAVASQSAVIDAGAITDVDFTGSLTIKQVQTQLAEHDIKLVVADAMTSVKEKLDRYGITALIGEDAYFPTVESSVQAFTSKRATTESDPKD